MQIVEQRRAAVVVLRQQQRGRLGGGILVGEQRLDDRALPAADLRRQRRRHARLAEDRRLVGRVGIGVLDGDGQRVEFVGQRVAQRVDLVGAGQQHQLDHHSAAFRAASQPSR